MPPALAIVLPVRDPARLPKVLGALDAQRAAAPECELFLVHVGHAAAIESAIRGHAPVGWRTVRVPTEAPSASAARSLGASRASAGRLLFLDDSTTPEPGLLGAHLALAERFPDAALQGQTFWSSDVAGIQPYRHWIAGRRWSWPEGREGEPLGPCRADPSNLSVPRAWLEDHPLPENMDAPYDAWIALEGADVRFAPAAVATCERLWTREEWLQRERALGAAAARARRLGATFPDALVSAMKSVARRRPRWLLATRWLLGGGDSANEWDAEAAHHWLAGYREEMSGKKT